MVPLLNDTLERTPFKKGHIFLAVSAINACNAPSHQRAPLIRTELFGRISVIIRGGLRYKYNTLFTHYLHIQTTLYEYTVGKCGVKVKRKEYSKYNTHQACMWSTITPYDTQLHFHTSSLRDRDGYRLMHWVVHCLHWLGHSTHLFTLLAFGL